MSKKMNERICDNCKQPFGDHFWPSLGGRCTQNPVGPKFVPVAERSPEPEVAPTSEAQAPAVPDERPKCPGCNSVGMRHCSDPEHCGGVYWPDSKYQALRAELHQLRARVAILDAQEVELADWEPSKDAADEWWERIKDHEGGSVGAKAWYQCALSRERQLLDALRAVQAWREAARKQNEALKFLAQEADGEISPATFEFANSAAAAYDALAGKGE